MKVSDNMSQSDRCELFGVLIDTVEDWLEEKGITPDDIPNPEREDEDSAIIYGSDYDYIADRFSEILGIPRDVNEIKPTPSIKKDVEELIAYANDNEYFEDNFGDAVYNAFMEPDNSLSDISTDIVAVFSSCKTENEIKTANDMLIAITGYSLSTLLEKCSKEISDKEPEL